MTSELEREEEGRIEKQRELLLVAVYGGVVRGVARSGGVFQGLSIRDDGSDVLMTLRAEFPAGRMVAFVGGYDMASCFIKAARESARDGLKWKEDSWRVNGG